MCNKFTKNVAPWLIARKVVKRETKIRPTGYFEEVEF
jgi:hypothetical protein